ncbi:MAG: BrnT family toxin [Bacteroidetes bacterium]|nr:MAG: BrnT family toxin [Bacteroidota bacterium]
MEFEWDRNKNNSNKEKHGISFEEAKEVFKDFKRIEFEDTRKDYGEVRYIVIGFIHKGMVSIVYTIRGLAYRIITARPANRIERSKYNK